MVTMSITAISTVNSTIYMRMSLLKLCSMYVAVSPVSRMNNKTCLQILNRLYSLESTKKSTPFIITDLQFIGIPQNSVIINDAFYTMDLLFTLCLHLVCYNERFRECAELSAEVICQIFLANIRWDPLIFWGPKRPLTLLIS